jgi:SpoU rRNA methylase family enzyme
MEPSALVLLERAEHAARERRLAAGLEAERLVADARRDAQGVESDAAAGAARAAASARHAVEAAAEQEIAALETGTGDTFRPDEQALGAARAVVVAALLGEVGERAAMTGAERRPPGPGAAGGRPGNAAEEG